jgi:hypothetical protein
MKTCILVTGSRNWSNRAAIRARLEKYWLFVAMYDAAALFMNRETIVIHGDAAGADKLADEVANDLGLTVVPVPYFGWLGESGGPARNRCMLQMGLAYKSRGYELVCEAFPLPGGRGTQHMIGICRGAGVEAHVNGSM